MTNIIDRLALLQKHVHVAKDKKNEFGGYSYRSAEQILAHIKPMLLDGEAITLEDKLTECAGAIFVTASATLHSEGEAFSATAHAMHPLAAKGKDASQITGSASSYARKYALQGLLAIDDGSVDPDRTSDGTQPGEPTLSERQIKTLTELSIQAMISISDVCRKVGVDHPANIPSSKFSALEKGLQNKILSIVEQEAKTNEENQK